MLAKRFLGENVLQAAQRRIAWTFDTFNRVYLSFSAGKDSTVMMHLVMEEAIKRNQKVGILFIDWEAQFNLTIDHAKHMFDLYADHIDPYWVSLPLLTTNACSMVEPEWICWQPEKRDLWVRELPEWAISDENFFPFYTHAMTFEEFIVDFGLWYGQSTLTAGFVGIRAGESLNRWRTIAWHHTQFEDVPGTSRVGEWVYNVYPIYDWRNQDIWTYHGKTGKPHNELYALMHKAGLPLSKMRICEPYGDEQRQGLWLYQIIEPETWSKVVARVAGANFASEAAQNRGNVMGNHSITLPDGHTWQSFTELLLNSMPVKTADHYKDKIAVWMHWYQSRGREIEDSLPNDCGAQDKPSWRRVCKMLLKNDYWCKTLCFSPNKSNSYMKYKKLMQKRRFAWGIFDQGVISHDSD